MTDRAAKLERRRRALAAPRRQASSDLGEVGIVVAVARQRMLIPIHQLIAIEPLPVVAPIPSADPDLTGLIAYRGIVLPVYRLSAFGSDHDALAEWDRVVVLGRGRPEIALSITAVEGPRHFDPEQLQPPPERLSAESAAILAGTTKDHIVVLDVVSLLERENAPDNERTA